MGKLFAIEGTDGSGKQTQFKKLCERFDKEGIDFWGITMSKKGLLKSNVPHIQSYFIVLSSKVFNSDIFNKFINSVKKEALKTNVIKKYEIGLTRLLEEQGYSWDVYCDTSKKYPYSQVYHYKELIINDNSPFVKTSIYRNVYIKEGIFPNYRILKKSDYNINLIKEDRRYNLYKTVIKIFYEQIRHFIRCLFIIFCDCL